MLVLVVGSLRVSKGLVPADAQEMEYRGHRGVLTLGACYLGFASLGQLEKIGISLREFIKKNKEFQLL